MKKLKELSGIQLLALFVTKPSLRRKINAELDRRAVKGQMKAA